MLFLFSRNGTLHFLSSGSKNEKRKSTLRKVLTFWVMEVSYIFSKESYSYISGNGTFLIIQETETPKKFFIFQETELSYISGGASKAPKTKVYYTSPKKVMDKFF